jgi:2-oxoglutarate ferredoxin oxidoreductase subunit alpha
VYAPASIQEAIDILQGAYDIAEEYQSPVMLLADGMLGQMMEPVVMPERGCANPGADIRQAKPWAVTGHRNERERNVIRSLRLKPEDLEQSIEERAARYEQAEAKLASHEAIGVESADVVFVAFGSTSRIVKDAMGRLSDDGVKCGLIRPISLWPFPHGAFDSVPASAKAVISVELSKGQLVQDVRLAVNGRKPVGLICRSGGILLSPEDVVSETKKILEVG